MAIPKDLKEQIKEFNSPQSRVLTTVLLIAAIVSWSMFLKQLEKSEDRARTCEENNDRKDRRIDSMIVDKNNTTAQTNRELKILSEHQDSTIKVMQKIINDIKR